MARETVTGYKIVLSENAGDVEKRAEKELKFFFKEATGAELNSISEKDAEYNPSFCLFSVGNTALLKKLKEDPAFLNEKEEDEYKDGVRLFSKGNMIFFAGSGNGALLSVYEFCEKIFGYKYYAADEWKIEKKPVWKVPVLDIEYYPSIPRRSLGFHATEVSGEHIDRLKLCNTLYSGWIEHCHTYFKILPKEKYYAEHRDWYSPDGKNLCLSNTKMREEFIRRVKEKLEAKKGDLFMLGQEDTFDFCSCEKCRKKIAEYGTASGLAMEFTNEVAKKTGEWLKKTHPARKVKFVTFAYNMTRLAPAAYNEYKGKYVPVDKKVVAGNNVAVMIVPYNAVYSTDYFQEKSNEEPIKQFLGWQAISNDLMVWSYCTVYQNYMIPFCNWDTLAKNYHILEEIGVSYLYDAASYDTAVASFEELRQYVHSSLMWNTDKSVSELIEEFTNVYYGEAASCMRYVIDQQKSRWYYIEGVYGKRAYAFDSFNELMDRKFWSKEYLDLLDEIFKKAYDLIGRSERAKILKNRIDKEYAAVRFFKLKLYPETLKNYEQEKKLFEEARKKFSLTRLKEGSDGVLAIN